MMLLTAKKTSVIRNYLAVIIFIMMASLGLAEVYTHPARLAQQKKINNYAQYISADIVLRSQNAFPR